MAAPRDMLTDDQLLADLTEPQREAVTHVEGPLLVLAGAGSGKTRVVTRRAAYLVARAGAARRILAVTFTNKAANELVERLAALGVAEALTAATFHSFCARTLRIYHDRAGLDPNFTIYDQSDRLQVIRQAIERCSLSETNFPPASIEERISLSKNALLGPNEFAADAQGWGDKTIARVFATYEQLMAEKCAVDFDDLLVKTARLLAADEDLRAHLEDRFRYVLVDEYQDTNVAQYEIARLLTLQHKNLCATGDPDQSIYRWRGADVGNILRFEHHYPEAHVVRLEQNYRSTKRILAAAHSLISRNRGRKPKELWTHNPEGGPVRIIELADAEAEAAWIAEEILRLERDGRRLGDIAIFYRTNMLSRVLEEAMLSHGIRYQVARGTAFYGRKEIKDLIAYVKVLINPADDVSLLRIINTPTRGIGQTTIERLTELAASQGRNMWSTIHEPELVSRLGKAGPRMQRFVDLLRDLRPFIDRHPGECLKEIFARTGLQAHLSQADGSEDSALANVLQLIESAEEFGQRHEDATVLDWLSHICLQGDADSIEESRGAVTLMTLHAAKGLEFPVVFIIGVEEGLIPFVRFNGDDGARSTDIEEERRLCFVGMTRARESLTLTLARFRMVRGQTIRTTSSPFLRELPRAELEILSLVDESGLRGGSRGFDARLPHDIEDWNVGSVVRHPDHGLGRITFLRRQGYSVWAHVLFKDGQSRTYNVAHSDLQLMDAYEVDDDTPF